MDYSEMAVELQEASDAIRDELLRPHGYDAEGQHYHMQDVTELAISRDPLTYFELLADIALSGQALESARPELLAESAKKFADFIEPFVQETVNSIIAVHLDI